ncbi:MAG: enoyl-CoA hydratase/isomerase family protein [Alphaproteobacteria bacterium]|nr:enoyl-CoA hydratase/isomerase family protein [Alphaproteobacteria bacterium]
MTRLVLDRAERGNALDGAMVEALIAALERAAGDGTRLVVLSGAGRSFCTGLDLGGLDAASDGDLLFRLVRIEMLLQAVHHAPMATAAFAHGRVFGAGADLFLACQHRVFAPGTRVSFPGPRFGIALGTGRLAARIGGDRAQAILDGGRVVETDEAHALGIAGAILDADGWPACVAELAREAALLAPDIARALRVATVADTRDRDLALLVRSAARPGLRDRIAAYVASLAR